MGRRWSLSLRWILVFAAAVPAAPFCTTPTTPAMLRKAPPAAAAAALQRASTGGGVGSPSSANKRPRLTAASASSSSSSSSSSPPPPPPPKGLPEIYATEGQRERPLRVLFVGHNPSEAAWRAGHYFANPSNRFWHLLRETGMIPPTYTCENDRDLPHSHGYGFTDLGTGIPGTKSGAFKANVLHSWRASFYQRIKAHAERSGGPPKILAFTGKRQYQELFFDAATKPTVAFGLQTARPKGFPFPPEATRLFVLTSSSGAAAMSNEARLAPYQELARLAADIPWEPED